MPAAPCPSHPCSRFRFPFSQEELSMARILYVLVVVLAILILVGKQNTTALSAELVDLIGKAGEVLLALLRKALA
jgi:hypothetical protein